MHRRHLLTLAIVGMAMCLAGTAWAQLPDPVPPPGAPGGAPPVRQNLGFMDTDLAHSDDPDFCRTCHEANPAAPSLVNRHHLLAAGQLIPDGSSVPFPDTDGDGIPDQFYGCLNCHGYSGTFNTGQIALVRNCGNCHQGSPHHSHPEALANHCAYCHGDLVDNSDDGHRMPDYLPSLVTPKAGLHGDGFYTPGDYSEENKERPNLGTGLVDVADGAVIDGSRGRLDSLGNHDITGTILASPGQDNDIELDGGSRYSEETFTVIMYHDPPNAPSAALETTDATDHHLGTLHLAIAPGVTTANDLLAQILLIPEFTGSSSSYDSKLFVGVSPLGDAGPSTNGEGTGELYADTHYEEPGGDPVNHLGLGAGSCSYCHDADSVGLILNNHDTHHHIDWAYPGNKCGVCHDTASYHDASGEGVNGAIRKCEICHGMDSLHNIQADSDGVNGVVIGGELSGFGHVGRDSYVAYDGDPIDTDDPPDGVDDAYEQLWAKDSDCWGCHGFYTGASLALAPSPIVPTLYNLDKASISNGADTALVLSGLGFVSQAGGNVYQSSVVLTAGDGAAVTLTAEAISNTSVTVTVPADIAAGNYRVQAVPEPGCASNPLNLSIVPVVKIASVKAEGAVVAITGSGFGKFGGASLGTSVTSGDVAAEILSWTDTEIVAEFPGTPDAVNVSSVFGKASAAVKQPAKPAANGGEPEKFRAAGGEDKVFSLGW